LSEIDLSKEVITKELKRYRNNNPDKTPLWFSQLTGGIDLHGAILKEANLTGANLQGAILPDANLQKAFALYANLQGASLFSANLQEAFLAEANLQEALLARTNLQKAWLYGANLQKACLSEAHLENTNLSPATTLAGADFYEAWLDHTRMTKEQLGGRIREEIDQKYSWAKETYLLLKNNFNQIGRYDDASWAYVKERQMEKMTYHPKVARKYYAKTEALPEGASRKSWTWWRFYVKYTLKWAWDWIIEGLCGYGERPFRTLGVALFVLLVFSGLFRITGGLSKGPNQTVTLGDYFLFSLASFATIDLPPLQATCPRAQFLATLEAITGISLLALLMFTLGNRISRS